LDNPTVRNRLNQEWNTSQAEAKERGGWILHNDATGQDSVWFDGNATQRDLCHDSGAQFGMLGPNCSDLPAEKRASR
jgi:hypothetical protein